MLDNNKTTIYYFKLEKSNNLQLSKNTITNNRRTTYSKLVILVLKFGNFK